MDEAKLVESIKLFRAQQEQANKLLQQFTGALNFAEHMLAEIRKDKPADGPAIPMVQAKTNGSDKPHRPRPRAVT